MPVVTASGDWPADDDDANDLASQRCGDAKDVTDRRGVVSVVLANERGGISEADRREGKANSPGLALGKISPIRFTRGT